MADISLPPVNTLVALQPVAVQGSGAQPSQVPPALAALPNGTLLSGFVLTRDAQNQPVLRTPQGDVRVATALFLKTGTEVVLRVDSSQPGFARIVTINGQTPELYAKQQGAPVPFAADAVTTSAAPLSAQAAARPPGVAGYMLQFQPEAAIPTKLIEQTLRALGVNQALLTQATAFPVTVMLRSLLGRPPLPHPAQESGKMPTPLPSPTPPEAGGSPQRPAGPSAPMLAATEELPLSLAQVQELMGATARTAPRPLPAAAPLMQPASAPGAPSLTAPPPAAATTTPGITTPSPPLSVEALLRQQNIASVQSLVTEEAAPAPTDPRIQATPATTPTTGAVVTKDTAAPPPHTPSAGLPSPPTDAAEEIHPAFRALVHEAPVSLPAPGTVRMEARVVGQEAGGDTILHTPLGILKAPINQTLTAGSRVVIELTPASTPQENAAPALASSLPEDVQELTQLARDWPALSKLYALTAPAEGAGPHPLRAFLPETGAGLTNGLLFFLSALKGGDLKRWTGERLHRMIETQQPELLRRIGAEFSVLQQASVESAQQGWMSTAIPVLHEGALHQTRLFIRQEQETPEDASTTGKTGGQRFIVEVDLSQLGEMQFDGFLTKDAGRNRFDMIVRSTRPLPLDAQQDIRDIYANATQAAGYTGMLTFQTSREQFVRPLSHIRTQNAPGILA